MLTNRYFFYDYDLDALTYKYGRVNDSCQGHGGVETSGSSTTVTGVASTQPPLPFGPLQVGYLVVFCQPPDTQYLRKVATKTSGAEITVDSAVTLTATGAWYYYPVNIGATSVHGWRKCSDYLSLQVNFSVETLASSGGIGYSIEGYTGDDPSSVVPVVFKQDTITSVGTLVVPVTDAFLFLRVGLKAGSAFAGTDSISVWMTGDQRPGRR
jgi:hypothetical protein